MASRERRHSSPLATDWSAVDQSRSEADQWNRCKTLPVRRTLKAHLLAPRVATFAHYLSLPRFTLSPCSCTNRTMSVLCLLLIALAHFASAVTLKEGLADKEKYIFYDTSPFNVGLHAGLALLITYGVLGTFTPSVMIITKALEKRRKRRSRTMSH
ncbi:hypothetical protein EGR_07132 [Echinococcus granulosus]|uniref:Uncharacterized protein n=2 Tax=Echinococcus granulosus TaxID=6210 RepID=W6UBU5_ECHGR|nr:hypothetical protein EGR_07132 [Echinococcus granulosus]EUB58026.1 hypothetical protein EGR_07132 [Echinococcus granulosus]